MQTIENYFITAFRTDGTLVQHSHRDTWEEVLTEHDVLLSTPGIGSIAYGPVESCDCQTHAESRNADLAAYAAELEAALHP